MGRNGSEMLMKPNCPLSTTAKANQKKMSAAAKQKTPPRLNCNSNQSRTCCFQYPRVSLVGCDNRQGRLLRGAEGWWRPRLVALWFGAFDANIDLFHSGFGRSLLGLEKDHGIAWAELTLPRGTRKLYREPMSAHISQKSCRQQSSW